MTRREELDALLERYSRLAAPAGAAGAAGDFAGRLRALRAWQGERLARTYADLRAEAHYARAVGFFLSDLYGPQEFTRRDEDLRRAWRYLKRALPGAAIDILLRAMELQVLTAELDATLLSRLVPGPITPASYAAAYRATGRRAARSRQIELIVAIGADLRRIVSHAWLARLLRAAHAPAHAAGFGVLQDFLERGFAAFRDMPDAERLLGAVRERETRFLETVFSGSEAPLAVGS